MTSNLSAALHNASVAFHRGIFQIQPVDLHSMPGWWASRVCWATKGWGQWDAQQRMHDLQRQFDASILFDHWGATRLDDGSVAFTTEPYADPTDPKFLNAVAGIAETLGVHVRILDPWQSWWYPGRTIRVEFAECPAAPSLCVGCKSREQMRDESRARKRERKAVRL